MANILIVCFTATLMGSLHLASSSTSTTTTRSGIQTTTAFSDNPEVQHIIQLFQNSSVKDCINTTMEVCTKEPANMNEFNRDHFCTMLKIYSQCIDKCGQALIDGVKNGRKYFSCDGCEFLQGSLLLLVVASLIHYLV